MKFYVKYFENYEEMMENCSLDESDFALLENCVKLEMIEEEFCYAKTNLFFNCELNEKSEEYSRKKHIKICVNDPQKNNKLKAIFNGSLLKIYNIDKCQSCVTYVAKPFLSKALGATSATSEDAFSDRDLKRKYLLCDKVSHKFWRPSFVDSVADVQNTPPSPIRNSRANANGSGDGDGECDGIVDSSEQPEEIFRVPNGQILNYSEMVVNKHENFSNYLLNIRCNLLSLQILKHDIYKDVSRKFSGMTLSYRNLLKNIDKTIKKLLKPNMFISKAVVKEISKQHLEKIIDGNVVKLKKSKVYGSIYINVLQNVLKRVVISIATPQNSTMTGGESDGCKIINVNLPNIFNFLVEKWRSNSFYHKGDFVEINNIIYVAKEQHFSKNISLQSELEKWEKYEKTRGSSIEYATISMQNEMLIKKINEIIEVVNVKIALLNREENITMRLDGTDNFLDINVGQKLIVANPYGKNAKNKGVIFKIHRIFDNDTKTIDVHFAKDEQSNGKNVMRKKHFFAIHQEKYAKLKGLVQQFPSVLTFLTDVVVENDYPLQVKKIINKKYTSIGSFEKDFENLSTKLKVKCGYFPMTIAKNIKIDL